MSTITTEQYEAERKQVVENLKRFSNNLSHEINNSLQTIMFAQYGDNPEAIAISVEKIVGALREINQAIIKSSLNPNSTIAEITKIPITITVGGIRFKD